MAVCKCGVNRCSVCARLGMERCFCHPVDDTQKLEELRQALKEHTEDALDARCARLEATQRATNLLTDDLQVDRLENQLHIDFEPQDRAERAAFSGLVQSELEIRLSDGPLLLASVLQGCLEDCHTRLRELIVAEKMIAIARSAVDRHAKANDVALR